jgi:molybdopterin molybdotransferase
VHTTVEQHAERIAALLEPALAVGIERLPLLEALHRVTAGGVLSPVDLPLFRNSQMDGFAVHTADLVETPVQLPIVGVVAARAASPAPLEAGTVVRIMTGAVVPEGADAVVPIEDTTADESTVTIRRSRSAGDYVRERGSDLRVGEELLPDATLLAPRHLAALAAAGIAQVEVLRRVRVAVVTTGAELVAPGEPVAPGQVFDANAVALVAAVQACGAEVAFASRVVDDPEQLLSALDSAVDRADLILTSGGISKGEFEVVRELLEPRGAHVTHLAMQPGGPQATAEFEGVPVVCFPGKRQYLRGYLEGGRAHVSSGPGSHLVAGLAAATVLIVVPDEVEHLDAGETVEVLHL